MKKPNITQGNWIIKDEMCIESENSLSIADVYWNSKITHTTMVPQSEGLSNVKLISAAPDLAEALNDMLIAFESQYPQVAKNGYDNHYNKAKAALLKAGYTE